MKTLTRYLVAVLLGLAQQLLTPPRLAWCMAKEGGIGMTVTVDDADSQGRDISNDVRSVRFGTPAGMIDVTGLDKTGIERIKGQVDGRVELRCAFNDASNMGFAVFKTMSSADVTRTVAIAISGQTLSMEMKISDLQFERGEDGSFFYTATLELADGTTPTWS